MEVREGQRWQLQSDLSTGAVTHWRAPFSDGFQCVVPAGTIVVVLHDPPATASAVGCRPVNYEALEPDLVPREDRLAEKYDGYSLVIDLHQFGTGLLPA